MAVWSDVPNADLPSGTAIYWTIVGGLTSQAAVLSSGSDTNYLKAPADRHPGIVNFQQNTTQIPAGAVVTGVDVIARVSKGSVAPNPAGMAPQITFALERTGYQQIAAFTRTIFPTSASPQNFTVASFVKSAGKIPTAWDVQELNLAQVKYYVNNAGVADTARLYQITLNVNYRTAPLVAVNTPTGNVFTPAPVITWSYTQTDGDAQSRADWAVFTAAQVNMPGFDPTVATPVQSGYVLGDTAQAAMSSALPVGSYYIYVSVTSVYGATSGWTGSRSFAVAAPSPGVPGIPSTSGPVISVATNAIYGSATLTLRDNSNRMPVSAADAEIFGEGAEWTTLNCTVARDPTNAFNDGVTSAQGSWQATANIPNAAANMLTANQASMETDASQWVAGSNTTLITDTTHPHAGTKDVKITSTASGNIQAKSNFKIAIASGGEYTITMWVYSTVAVTAYLQAEAFDAATGTIDKGTLGNGFFTTLNANSFTQLSITITGVNAYQVQINLNIAANAASQAFYFDDVSMLQTTRMVLGSGYIEIAANEPFTCAAQFLAIATSRNAFLSATFFDANFTSLGNTVIGPTVTESTTTWTTGSMGATTPGNVSYCQILLEWDSVVNGELHNVDRLGVMYGTNTPWSDGGQAGRNLLSAWYSTSEDTAQAGESWTTGAATTLAVVDNPLLIGRKQQQMTYTGLSPTIALRGAGTAFTRSNTAGNTYTLNKPASVATGDLMLAFVSTNSSSSAITPAAGWTLFDTVNVTNGGFQGAMFVLARTATSSEPASWTDGVFSNSPTDTIAIVVAYSGAAALSSQLVDHAVSALGDVKNYETTGTVNNTDANAWLVSAFMGADTATGGSWTGASTAGPAPGAIAYVGTAAGSVSSGSFSISKPGGVQSGDFMIASVAVYGTGVSVTAPTGWTAVDQISDGDGTSRLTILTRVAGASEPSSWSGTFTYTTQFPSYSSVACAAYRNTAGLLGAHSIKATGATATSFTSNTISITDSRQWSVGIFLGITDASTGGYNAGRTWSGAESNTRLNQNPGNSSSGLQATHTYFDSGAGQPIGSDTDTAHFTDGDSFTAAVAWIATLAPATSSSGTAQTSRASATAGTTSDNVMGIFDSNGVAPLGPNAITGHYVRSTSQFQLALGWAALIRPINSGVAGSMSVVSATQFDLSNITADAWRRCDGLMTFSCMIFGSTGGTPQFTLTFYRANQPIQVMNAVATSFNSSFNSLCGFTFTPPQNATSVTVGITATNRSVGDTMNFDHPSLALGSVAVYQAGTNRQYHPIWAYPEIQYADDRGLGFSAWQELAGVGTLAPSYDYLTGNVTFVDHTIIPLVRRKYRARTITLGQAGDMAASPWSSESVPVEITGQNWWLKDIANPANNLQLKEKWETFSTERTNTATSWQPLGENFPVMLTEGFKSEKFTVSLIPANRSDFAQLEALLERGTILFLQTDIDRAWWVRPEDNLKADMLPTNQRRMNPLRAIQQTFLEMSPTEAPV